MLIFILHWYQTLIIVQTIYNCLIFSKNQFPRVPCQTLAIISGTLSFLGGPIFPKNGMWNRPQIYWMNMLGPYRFQINDITCISGANLLNWCCLKQKTKSIHPSFHEPSSPYHIFMGDESLYTFLLIIECYDKIPECIYYTPQSRYYMFRWHNLFHISVCNWCHKSVFCKLE